MSSRVRPLSYGVKQGGDAAAPRPRLAARGRAPPAQAARHAVVSHRDLSDVNIQVLVRLSSESVKGF